MKEKKFVIYKTTNLITGKIYVGQDSNNNPNYLGSGTKIRESIKQFGKLNFVKEILENCATKEYLNEREVYWIKSLNATDPLIGYNRHRGKRGKDTLGTRLMNDGNKHYYIYSDDVSNKLLLGYVFGPLNHVVEKCRLASSGKNNSCYGKTANSHPRWQVAHTEESKNKIKLKNIGKNVSLKTKQLQSIAKSGSNNPMYGISHKKVSCEYCNISIGINVYARFHGDKCKKRTKIN
jgi:hypothetical protein